MIWFFWSFRRHWHPWLFILAVGTAVAALVAGDVITLLIAGAVAWWAVVAGSRSDSGG